MATLERKTNKTLKKMVDSVVKKKRPVYDLRKMITLAGDNLVYCDTDSLKFVGELDLGPYNAVSFHERNMRKALSATGTKNKT